MHFSVLLFHESGEESIMEKYHCDATPDCGADIQFVKEFTKKTAQTEYKKHIKSNPKDKVTYPDYNAFMSLYHGYEYNEIEGGYGYSSNSLSLYDWYEVGGRYENILPGYSDEKELKNLLKAALNLKNKEVNERFRDKVNEYVEISSLPLFEACDRMNIGRTNWIEIKKECSPQIIIDSFKRQDKETSERLKMKWNENDDAVTSTINMFIVEYEDGTEKVFHTEDNVVNEKTFSELYNHFSNLHEQTGREFFLTVLDLHL